MPLKLNVGLARKVGEANYSSRGASVHMEIELESALATDPDKLKERIRQLFNALRSSLTEELSGKPVAPANPSNGHQDDNGHAENGDLPPPARPATPNQIKAIHAIARSQQLDVGQFLRERFQRECPEDLTIKEASGAIDDLKRRDHA